MPTNSRLRDRKYERGEYQPEFQEAFAQVEAQCPRLGVRRLRVAPYGHLLDALGIRRVALGILLQPPASGAAFCGSVESAPSRLPAVSAVCSRIFFAW